MKRLFVFSLLLFSALLTKAQVGIYMRGGSLVPIESYLFDNGYNNRYNFVPEVGITYGFSPNSSFNLGFSRFDLKVKDEDDKYKCWSIPAFFSYKFIKTQWFYSAFETGACFNFRSQKETETDNYYYYNTEKTTSNTSALNVIAGLSLGANLDSHTSLNLTYRYNGGIATFKKGPYDDNIDFTSILLGLNVDF